jgi:hypothetical protein
MGEPAPKSINCKFVDVDKNGYYYSALLWAVENNITKGTSDTTFAPNMTLTREQFITLLWRAAGEPSVNKKANFTDVPSGAYYEKAVQWAVEEKITEGVGNNLFAPRKDCTRSQVVTLLLRYSESKEPTTPSTPQFPIYPTTPSEPTDKDPSDSNKPAVDPSNGVGGKYETNWDV